MDAIHAVSMAALLQLWHTGATLVAQGQALDAPTVRPDPDALLIVTAETLGWPMQSVQLVHQVGRVCQVSYTPLRGYDPDVLVVLEGGPAAARFRSAIHALQQIRRDQTPDLAGWYERARQAGTQLIKALHLLEPTLAEAIFVIRWTRLIAATGDFITDGIQPVRPRLAPISAQESAEIAIHDALAGYLVRIGCQ